MFARPFWTPKWFLGGPWAPEGGPKNPKRPENTSPKAPQRGPKGAQEGSQDNFDVLTWKNARPSEYSVIYDTKCMSELSTPVRKSPKIGPRDLCFAYLHAHCSRKRSKSAPEPKKVAIRSVFVAKKKIPAPKGRSRTTTDIGYPTSGPVWPWEGGGKELPILPQPKKPIAPYTRSNTPLA